MTTWPNFRPMLCAETITDPTTVRFPLMCSYKLDGMRAVILPQGPRTRSLKNIPNDFVHQQLRTLPVGLDGELAIIEHNEVNFKKTMSGMRAKRGSPAFRYFVFDYIIAWGRPFKMRYDALRGLRAQLPYWVEILPQQIVNTPAELSMFYSEAIKLGYEGVIMRDPMAQYKFNRSTVEEQGMLRMKPCETEEAIVVDCLPLYENLGFRKSNELGLTVAGSSSLEHRFATDKLGSLVVRSQKYKSTFKIGTGFTDSERRDLWKHKPIGQYVTFEYAPNGGYDVPRQPRFKAFRPAIDR